MSGDVFAIQQGTLYPALQRMKRKGWVDSEWRITENNRRARYYFLTDAGRRQIAAEREEWERIVSCSRGERRKADDPEVAPAAVGMGPATPWQDDPM